MANFDDDISDDIQNASQKSPKKKNLVLFIVIGLIVIIGGAAAIFAILNKNKDDLSEKVGVVEIDSQTEKTDKGDPKKETLILFDLPEINVQLGGGDVYEGNLRINLNIEISALDDVKRIEALMPKILDIIASHTAELSYDEIRGTKGLFFLKEELLFRINTLTSPLKVYNLNFKNIQLTNK